MAARMNKPDLDKLLTQPGYSVVDTKLGHAAVHLHPPGIDPAPLIETLPDTDEAELNKTERAFLEKLRGDGYAWIGIQSFKLKLADNTTYTPDFWSFRHGERMIAWEVKGFWRDDARVKIKVAAHQYRFFDFIAVQRKGGQWTEEKIKR